MMNLVIYDLDGTLVDTREDIVRAINFMLEQMDLPEKPSAEVSKYVGRGLHHLVGSCLGSEEIKTIEKGAKFYRGFYAEHMMDNSRLFPGAREILDYFKARGSRQAVITNKPNPFSQRMLDNLGVGPYFTDIIPGNSPYAQKPDLEAVQAILKKENVAPREAVFVGDSLIDIETGRNAGIWTAVVRHGFGGEDELKSARPDFMTDDFKKLLELAKERGW